MKNEEGELIVGENKEGWGTRKRKKDTENVKLSPNDK